jgi:hypothetical protein
MRMVAPVTEIFLILRIERDIAAIVHQQIELNLIIARVARRALSRAPAPPNPLRP